MSEKKYEYGGYFVSSIKHYYTQYFHIVKKFNDISVDTICGIHYKERRNITQYYKNNRKTLRLTLCPKCEKN